MCPDGFYGDEDSSECEECHADCDTCSGPEEDDCLSCEEGKMLESSLCVPDDEACPIKTFLSGETNADIPLIPRLCVFNEAGVWGGGRVIGLRATVSES